MIEKQDELYKIIMDNLELLSTQQLDAIQNAIQTMFQELDMDVEEYAEAN